MRSESTPKLGWITLGAFAFAACSAKAPATDDGGVEASMRSRNELGVHRWSTANLPGAIEGLDSEGSVIVSLRHESSTAEVGPVHRYALQHGQREARIVFAMTKNAAGADTFMLLEHAKTSGFAPGSVLDRVRDDLDAVAARGLTGQNISTGRGELRPADLVEGDGRLVCGTDILIVGADSCLNHLDEIDDAFKHRGPANEWASACSSAAFYSRDFRPPAEAFEDISCWRQGEGGKFRDCVCIDLSTVVTRRDTVSCRQLYLTTWRMTEEFCGYRGTGRFDKTECGADCEVQEPFCELRTSDLDGCPKTD